MSDSFNEDFELDILIAASGDFAYRRRIQRMIKDVDIWSTDAHRELWDVVNKLGASDKLTTKVLVHRITRLEDAGRDSLADDLEITAKRVLGEDAGAPEYAAETLREWVGDYRARVGLEEAIKFLGDGDYEKLDETFRSLSRRQLTEAEWTGGNWLAGFEGRQEKRILEREDPTLAPTIPTRLKTLDRVMHGGLRQTKVGLVVGHTGRGKSAIVLGFAFIAGAKGHLTVYISTEMSKELVDTRLDARAFGYPVGDFATAKFTVADLEDFEERRERLAARVADNIWTYSIPPKMLTLAKIHEILDEVEEATGRKVDQLVVDSPDHMSPMTKMRDYRLEQAAVYWDLKQVAEDRDKAVWASCQGSKEYIGKLLTAEGTSESYDKARIADVILTLNQSPEEEKESIVRMFVAKNRSGEKGAIIYLATDFARMHVEETEPPTPTSPTSPPTPRAAPSAVPVSRRRVGPSSS